MLVFKTFILCAAYLAVNCQNQREATTPVPILKQINRQNDDGSYSFGYEGADGSFKIETKYPNGDVAGKYGYVDESGKMREVSYGATSQRGFEPEGPGIQVPPPTLNNPSTNALTDGQEDDGQYREDPRIYEDPKYNGRTHSKSGSNRQYIQYSSQVTPTATPSPARQYQSLAGENERSAPVYTQQTSLFDQRPQQFNQEYRPQSQVYHQQPQFSYQAYTPQQNYEPQSNYQQHYQPQTNYQQNYQPQVYSNNQDYNPFFGHPAQNFDPNTGSYSINFTG